MNSEKEAIIKRSPISEKQVQESLHGDGYFGNSGAPVLGDIRLRLGTPTGLGYTKGIWNGHS